MANSRGRPDAPRRSMRALHGHAIFLVGSSSLVGRSPWCPHGRPDVRASQGINSVYLGGSRDGRNRNPRPLGSQREPCLQSRQPAAGRQFLCSGQQAWRRVVLVCADDGAAAHRRTGRRTHLRGEKWSSLLHASQTRAGRLHRIFINRSSPIVPCGHHPAPSRRPP